MESDEFNWRAFLGEITREPQEKQRLADIMNVSPITLTRWVNTGSRSRTEQEKEKPPRPQVQSLRKLVAALPEHRAKLIPSILQEYRDLTEDDFQQSTLQSMTEEPISIPTICYEQVLEAAATLTGELRFTTICDHLLNYALQQLDPERLGFAITILKCVQPQSGYKVRSQQEVLRIGTPPWNGERQERQIFRGAESLAGRAITTSRSYEVGNINTYVGWLPTSKEDDDEVSIAVCPILRARRVAGCLHFSSTQADYFTRERMRLIQKYAYLVLEAFEEADFYAAQDIELRLMPNAKAQEPFLRSFNSRVEEVMAQGKITNWLQAVQMALHLIESDLINLSMKERPF
jgi:putative methionine-R-sulfoxide reductase with GAF domain